MILSRRRLLAGLGALPLVLFGAAARAQPAPVATTYAIFDQKVPTHRLKRRLISCADGRVYQIFSAIPRGFRFSPCDVLYLLDGNAVFDQLTPALLAQAEGLALIGIGYDTDLRFDARQRALDYTPPGAVETRPGAADRALGGADAFLSRLEQEIFPVVERFLPTRERVIWGHSYGGVCALYGLLTRPEWFSGVAAISPSLRILEPLLPELIEGFKGFGMGLRRPVYLAWGEREETPKIAPESLTGFEELAVSLTGQVVPFVSAGRYGTLSHGQTFMASLPKTFAWMEDLFRAEARGNRR